MPVDDFGKLAVDNPDTERQFTNVLKTLINDHVMKDRTLDVRGFYNMSTVNDHDKDSELDINIKDYNIY